MTVSTVESETQLRARPGSEGANIRTWVGFKHFAYLVEAGILEWFRDRDAGPARLYHEHGLELSLVDCSMLLPAVLEVDDEVDVTVSPTGPGRFRVRLTARRGDGITVCRAKVTVALVRRPEADPGPAADPALLEALGVPLVDRAGGDHPGVALPAGAVPLEVLGPDAFGWAWRAPYFYCQYSDRVAHSGYVRALEEVVDRFLADRGLSVGRLLTERGWIPVVSRSRVTILADAHMEETILTTFRVGDILGGVTFDARMDCHVQRGDRLVPVATAQILHGYAVSRGPGAGQLAQLDPAVLSALTGAAR